MKRLLALFSAFFVLTLSAQRTCGTSQKIVQLSQNPEFYARHQAIQSSLKNARSSVQKSAATSTANTVITIPVVFHILYKTNSQNISDSQINSQLAVMNADFRKQNADFSSVVPAAFQCHAADLEVCFVKASVDPNGQPTNGVTRKAVTSDFDLETQYYTEAGEAAWDTSVYLNIWVGRFQTFGYLGFGTPPAAAGEAYDGLVISYKAIGCSGSAIAPFNKGRTVIHEIGHYLGLSHPWGEDNSSCGDMANSDGVDDTPAINDPHFGLPSYPENSNMCEPDENGAMFMNFMDYVDDEAMAFFTDDQKVITQATLAGPRASLLGTKGVTANLGISVYPNPADKFFTVKSENASLEKAEIYNVAGQLQKVAPLGQIENTVALDNLGQGVYFIRIYGNGGKCLKSDKLIKK